MHVGCHSGDAREEDTAVVLELQSAGAAGVGRRGPDLVPEAESKEEEERFGCQNMQRPLKGALKDMESF